MRDVLALTAGLVAGGATPAAAPEPVVFDVQFLVLKTAPRGGKFTAERMVSLGKALVLQGRFAVDWGGESLKSDGRSLLANGVSLSTDPGRAEPKGAGTPSVLSRPRVTTLAGEMATLKAGTTENTQYFSREPDGHYALKTVPLSPEMQFDVTLDRPSSGAEVQMLLAYRLVRLGPRASLDGVSLDVGAPEIEQDEGTGRFPVKLDEWCLVALQSDMASGLALAVKATWTR